MLSSVCILLEMPGLFLNIYIIIYHTCARGNFRWVMKLLEGGDRVCTFASVDGLFPTDFDLLSNGYLQI